MELHQLIKYFGNDCSAEEQQAIEAWRNASAENNASFLRLKKMWEASQHAPESIQPDFEKAWKNIVAQTGIRERRAKQVSMSVSLRNLMRIAATVIILVGIGLLARTLFLSKPA